MQSLASAPQNTAQVSVQTVRPRVKVGIPIYTGYHDYLDEYLDRLLHYQQGMRLFDAELLERVVPVSLSEQAARWFRLIKHRACTVEEFHDSFSGEFLLANYECRLQRELELRTQHLDESLLEYVRAMDELYRLANFAPTSARSAVN